MTGDIITLKNWESMVKEQYARQKMQERGFKVFAPDWTVERNDELTFIEVKAKSDKVGIIAKKWSDGGHGMENYQFINYMKMYRKYGIRTLLLVYDASDGCIYEQYLDVLDKVKDVFRCQNNKIISWNIKNFEVVGKWK